jgi:hypothetical protein
LEGADRDLLQGTDKEEKKNKKSVSMSVGSPLKIEDSAGAFQIHVNRFTAISAG